MVASGSAREPQDEAEERVIVRMETPDGVVHARVHRDERHRIHADVLTKAPLSGTTQEIVQREVRLRFPTAALRFIAVSGVAADLGLTGIARPSRPPRRDAELDALRESLVDRFSPSIAELDPVPRGLVEQARRFAELAADLMSTGAFDHDALAEGWDTSVETARKRVQRAADRGEIFTVSYKDRTFVPAFLLDERLDPRPELTSIIGALTAAGDRGFALWSWLTTPSPWLDGEVPHELASRDVPRVQRAVAERTGAVA